MAFDQLEYVRIEGEFLSLAGGDVWERVELAAWQRLAFERATSTAKQTEFRSRAHGRNYHREYERQRRRAGKAIPRVVRCCAVCRRMHTLSATQVADGTRFCSPRCAGKYRIARSRPKPTRMVTIGRKTRALPAWAQHYGITVGMVYKRMRDGMTDVEALSTPKRKR